jgi:hypothetical protein
MFSLPKSLGAIAKVCDQRESTRFALQCVKLEADAKSGDVVISATDSKSLIIATVDTDNSDAVPAVMIDGAEWSTIFGLAKTEQHVDVDGDPVGQTSEEVAVESVAELRCTFAVGNKSIAIGTTPGKYPPADKIMSDTRKKPLEYSIRVDPLLLARQLQTMAEVCEQDSSCGITLEFRGKDTPIICEMKGDKVKLVALLMPRNGDE